MEIQENGFCCNLVIIVFIVYITDSSYLTIKTEEALASKYQKQQLPFFLNLLSCNLKFYNIADFY
jgi:hypothetical protein